MKLINMRELLVLTYISENGSRPISDIQAELKISNDEDFKFEETLNDLIKEESVMPIISEIPKWEITEMGKIHLKDLEHDKYEEDNKMSYIIWGIILALSFIFFWKIFPRLWALYISHFISQASKT
jgi:hypothetical protein